MRLSKADRRKYAYWLILYMRFQDGQRHGEMARIYGCLSDKVCRKAGFSRKRLNEILEILCKWGDKHKGEFGKLAYKDPSTGDYILMSQKAMKGRFRDITCNELTKALCTLTLTRSHNVTQVMKELDKTVFMHIIAQTISGAQTKHDKGSSTSINRQQASFSTSEGEPKEVTYKVHPSLSQLDPVAVKYEAALPSKATAAKMGISRRTFFRRVSQFEGDIERTNRRVKLDPVADVDGFHKEWGIYPFQVNGLWYGQASNLYSVKKDFRGPNCEKRKCRGYGKSLTEILANPKLSLSYSK